MKIGEYTVRQSVNEGKDSGEPYNKSIDQYV